MTAPSAAMRAAEEIVGLPYGSNAEIDAQILHVSGIIARHARHCPEAPDAAQRVIDARDAYWRVVSGSHTREICDARWEDLDGAIDTLRAALAASPAGEAWRPIEPADRDGRIEWLGLEADGAVCRVRWYFDESTDDGWYDHHSDRDCRPVLIAPFPVPPAEAGR